MNTEKPSITVLKWICIFLCVPFSIKCQIAGKDSIFYQVSDHHLELVYLEKDIFESKTQAEKNIYLLQKAYVYKERMEFGEAANTLARAYISASSDSVSFLLGYETALCNYLNKNYSKAKISVIQLNNYTKTPDQIMKMHYLEALIALEMQHWDAAKLSSSHIKPDDPFFQDSIDILYTQLEHIRLKDPDKAENLSYIIPGAGQIYAGKTFRGLTSFLLQTSLLGFAGYSFLNGYYFSGTFTGVSLFYVFYMGGARHAEYLAQEYNRKKIDEITAKIKSHLYAGVKKETISQ